MSQPPQAQQLSHKDGALFRQVVRHFENKQYKKGLKAAEQILKKSEPCRYPSHESAHHWHSRPDRACLCPREDCPRKQHEVARMLARLRSAIPSRKEFRRVNQGVQIC